jgi:hypothetical protein
MDEGKEEGHGVWCPHDVAWTSQPLWRQLIMSYERLGFWKSRNNRTEYPNNPSAMISSYSCTTNWLPTSVPPTDFLLLYHQLTSYSCTTNWLPTPVPPTDILLLYHQLTSYFCTTNWLPTPVPPTDLLLLYHQLTSYPCTTNWLPTSVPPTDFLLLYHQLTSYSCTTNWLAILDEEEESPLASSDESYIAQSYQESQLIN